ncbi:MAG TPA: tyrosine-type recombinase/integrase [Terriglobia bacterium]|nr:tyrosine-type recombinase/integrase [Terriglobia bacterium]
MQIENDADGVSTIGPAKNKHTSAMDRDPLTPGQIQAVMEIADPEWKGIVTFGQHSGQRLRDIARLRWQDIDQEQGIIRFPTRKGTRVIPVGIAPAVAEYLATTQKPTSADSPIFPKAYEVVMRDPMAMELRYRFGVMQKKAKLKPWSFYMLRITFFKNLQSRGVPVMTIRHLLATHSRM